MATSTTERGWDSSSGTSRRTDDQPHQRVELPRGPGFAAGVRGRRPDTTSIPTGASGPLRHGPAGCQEVHARDHRSEEHTSELQSLAYLVCRLLLEKKKKK